MTTDPVTKQQYYVPQFYLKQFAESPTGKLQVLDFDLMKILKPRVPRSLCRAPFFYALETGLPDETSQVVEQYLAERESAFANDLPPIIESLLNPNQHIYDVEKRVIAGFMSMMWVSERQSAGITSAEREPSNRSKRSTRVFVRSTPQLASSSKKPARSSSESVRCRRSVFDWPASRVS